jgi:hypothetical protein
VTDEENPGGFASQDAELDALLSAADKGMLDAIRDNLDLDAGFAQALDASGAVTPASRPAPATHPKGKDCGGAHAHRNTPDPLHARNTPAPPHPVPALAARAGLRELSYSGRAAITVALALVAALYVALFLDLTQDHGGAFAQPVASAPYLPAQPPDGFPAKPHPGEPPRGFHPPFYMPQRLAVLDIPAGTSMSLKFAADSAGIGGHPVISYVKDYPSGPTLLLFDFPEGTHVRLLSADTGQPATSPRVDDQQGHPFHSRGEQFPPKATIAIAGPSAMVILKTMPDQPGNRVYVIVTRFPNIL